MKNDALFEDYLANRLAAEGVVEMKRILASDKQMRTRFVEVLQEWELISDAARQITANSHERIGESLVDDSSNCSLHTDVALSANRRRPAPHVAPMRTATRRAISVLLPVGVLAASLAVVLILTEPTEQVAPLATLASTSGPVVVVRANKELPGKSGTNLFLGDRIQISDGGLADVFYPDRTVMHIDQRTEIQLAETVSVINQTGKRVVINWGRVSADVSKQPVGQPMLFVTPNAQAEVLGTALTLEYTESLTATRLEVDHGLVAITDVKSLKRVEVPTAHYAMVMANQLPVALPLVHRPIEVTKDYRPGLRATYFAGNSFHSPLFDSIEPNISADLGLEVGAIDMRQSNFSVRWDGYLQPLFSEKYLLTLRCDAGVRLYLDGKLVIDQWKSENISEHQIATSLDASTRHQIRVEYRQPNAGKLIRLSWVSASQSSEVIPVERFSTDK
jgi:PA14 domain/FecR protein